MCTHGYGHVKNKNNMKLILKFINKNTYIDNIYKNIKYIDI